MNSKDIDDFFASDSTPEPPPEIVESPAPPPAPPKARPQQKSNPLLDLTLDAGLPANVGAEKTILGSILLDNEALKEITVTLAYDDFFLDSHRRIWKRMAELYAAGRPIDIVTLASELSKNKEVEAVGGVAYIASLTEGLPRRPVIDEYIRIVADKSLSRKIMHIGSAIVARAADQSETAIQTLNILEAQLVELKDRSKLLSRVRNPEPFFVGYRTFSSTAPKEIDWTVDGIIQRDGNGLILGDSGTSKSLMVFDLALHLVAGVSWFHHAVPSRMRVGLVAREDSPGLSQSRLMRLIEGSSESVKDFLGVIDLEEWLYVNTRSQRETWSLQKELDVQEIIESTKERGIQILFFDVFRTLWDGNENDNQETAKVLEAAAHIGREANCQVVIVHHLSKSDRGTIFDRARGGGINGWKQWGIGITVENPDAEPRDQIRRMIFHTKASCAATPIHYRIQSDDKSVCLVEVNAPTQQYNYGKSKKDKKDKPTDQSRISYDND